MARPVKVVIDEAAIRQLAQGDGTRGLLTDAAHAALSVARAGAPAEGGFRNSFSIKEGVRGRGSGSYVWVRVWNSSPIANLIEFGAPKRRGPRKRMRVLGRALDAAVGKLIGG
ncbi:hypothetical protein ACIHFE_18040 [Streptomyces sp. NPDC052396]|uniref:hypothetical protein n=1 Tax=Streptomyces sp. NPDC052396 TaxID=3365689 RepID=UPI0037CD95E2